MISWWLPVVVPKSQSDKAYWLPDIGEQVVCMMDEHDEDGAVLGAIYSKVDSPPVRDANKVNWTFKDGTSLEYDRGAHALACAMPAGTLTISVSGASIAVDANGNVIVASINAASNVSITASGQLLLGSLAVSGVARLGDSVTCPAGTGTITTASTIVLAE